MSEIRIAVIGTGALGRHHARILAGMDGAELVAVCDVDETRGRAVAEACGTRWVLDYRDVLRGVDACTIAVPTRGHFPIAVDLVRRGIPVLVEKPLSASIDEAEALVELAEARGVTLGVGHVERFNPAFIAAQDCCHEPRYIRAERLSPYAFRSIDIGVVHDVMIHDLDLVLALVDAAIERVEAFGVSILGGHEDAVQARVFFENGCLADFTANRVNPTTKRSTQIWSAEGAVSVDFASRELVRYRPSETLLYGTSPLERAAQPDADIEALKASVFGTFLEVTHPPVPAGDALTAELADFVDCVRTGRRPVVDGPAALRVLSVAEQILESVARHQWDARTDGAVGPHLARPRRRLAG